MNIRDLAERPHDRGVLTYYEFLCLIRDWERAGSPTGWDDFLDFMANTWPWEHMEVWWLTNTLAELEATARD